MFSICLYFYLLFHICLCCLDELKSHCIESLPSLNGNLSSTHYSGYLDAGNKKWLFYWLVESESDPIKDSLIFWFNGGPGCSSLEGLFSESGPYLANNNGTLRKNPNAWTRFASIVYIDSLEFVGFSYSTDHKYDDIIHYSDDKLHRRFAKSDIYFFGESYASTYVSLLSERILRGKYEINLKGILIGNGVIDENLDIVTSLQFYHYHGFIDQPVMNEIIFRCESMRTKKDSVQCFRNATINLQNQVFQHINLYSIFDECDESSAVSSFRCVPISNATFYLNRVDVQHQIHVSRIHANLKWSVCKENQVILVDSDEFDPLIGQSQFVQQYSSMKAPLQRAIKAGVRVFFIYGDADSICNFLTGEIFADYLGTKKTSKHPWPNGKKIYGFLTTYNSHHFATVLGGGHMVSQHKPVETAAFVRAFIQNKLD